MRQTGIVMLSSTFRAVQNHWPISAHCYANDMLILCRPHDESERLCYANNMLILCRPSSESQKH